jgi:hypothetical protein
MFGISVKVKAGYRPPTGTADADAESVNGKRVSMKEQENHRIKKEEKVQDLDCTHGNCA